jgi:hypothetical protein
LSARLVCVLPLVVGCTAAVVSAPDAPAGADAALAHPDAAPPDAAPPDAGAPDAAGPTTLTKVRTEYVGRLIGTARTPLEPLGLIGTDLGVSFVQDGKLLFLFGDSWTTPADTAFWNDDSIAWTTPTPPVDGSPPPLLWYTGADGRFLSLGLVGVDLGGMNVPVEGIADGVRTWLFFSTGWSDASGTHSTSVLGHTDGLEFDSIIRDHAVPSAKFINVSAVTEGSTVYLFGSGPYRKSPVYLARVELATIADRSSWAYWDGASWSAAGETAAAPIVDVDCVGELSVRKHPSLGLYLMAYNCGAPRGIVLHTAPAPTGPWSPGQVIFDPDPSLDQGYGFFMHQKVGAVGYDDGIAEIGREEEWGGEYGPYLIPGYFTDDAPGVHTIVYALSSWNPYAVHLVRTVLAEPGATVPAPTNRGAGLPPTALRNADFAAGFTGWQAEGDPFVIFTGPDGVRRVTTYDDKGDAAVGRLWQDFTVDATVTEIDFAVHGGHAAVELWRGGDLVRRTRGRNTNDVDLPVRWRLGQLRGETLRLVIDDDQTDAWGFVGTTGFSFK